MIFRAWAVRSGPKSTEVRTTRQTVNVGMTSSLFGAEWRKYSRRLLSRSGRYCPLKDKNPARPNHADFMACDYNIEQLHREGKQVTGLERCQCRKARIQRHHIGCAFLVWVRLKALAAHTGRTVYQLKHGLLDDYLIQQLRNPSLRMVLA